MRHILALVILATIATCSAVPSHAKEYKLHHYGCVPLEENAKQWHKRKYNSSPMLLGTSPRIGPIILFVNPYSMEWAITNENEDGQHCIILTGKILEWWDYL